MTFNEILEFTDNAIDRVTLYRTLKSFEILGVIHRVVGVEDVTTYALLQNENNLSPADLKSHFHFCCTECNGIFCLNDYQIPRITLPNQYLIHSLNLTIGSTQTNSKKEDNYI